MAEGHPRAGIRAFVVERLQGLAALATVTASRVHNFRPNELPGAAVYTRREASERDSLRGTLKRALDLVVEIYLEGGDSLDDEADALCLAVEAALAADLRFGRQALDSFLLETMIGLSGEGERRLGLARLTYRVIYRTGADGSAA